MPGRPTYELALENTVNSISAGFQSKDSFCVTYKIAQRNANAPWAYALPTLNGWKGEVMSILQHNITTAQDAAETISVGILGGTTIEYVNVAPVPIVALGGSQRIALVAGASGLAGIPSGLGVDLVVNGTSAGSVGVSDYSITIRYFR